MSDEMFSLAGRTAVIAGAGGGIGRATAHALGALGARLVLADRGAPDDLAAELAGQGRQARAVGCRVDRRDEVEALLASVERPDIAVFTAAVCPWDDWTEAGWDDAWDEVIATNLKGAVDFSRAALRAMAGRGGRIVLVSSLAGRNGGLIASPHYVASKGGMNAFVKWLARRGAPDNVLVNAVAPASVRTPMMAGREVDLSKIPLGRMAEPDEVAGPIAFLCSPAASYVTGVVLDVNGGVYL